MFSDIFKQLIQNSGITVYKISKDTGISESLMSQWKSGRQLPKYDSLNILADYFQVSGDYLLGRTDNPEFKAQKKPVLIENPPKPKQTTVLLPLYDEPASAGTGNWLESDTPLHYVTVVKDEHTKRTDFLIRVSGDSMLPKFSDGDIVCVQKTPAIDAGEIGVFIINGDSFIKKMGNFELVSLNPEYDNIRLLDTDSVMCSGRVLGIAQII